MNYPANLRERERGREGEGGPEGGRETEREWEGGRGRKREGRRETDREYAPAKCFILAISQKFSPVKVFWL